MPQPPFFLTYWNPFNQKSPGLGQSFLNYVKDISLINYATSIITSSNIEVKETLENGFSFLDQRLGLIHQEQINTNILLKDVTEVLKLPDSEKERKHRIELGIKFLDQARKDEDLAEDAVNEFQKALKLMPQDWFVSQQLGILHLFYEKVQDVEKAKSYFFAAAKYATADSVSENENKINDLYKNQFDSTHEFGNNSTGLKVFIREAYLNAALSAYIMTEFEEATKYVQKALLILPDDTKCLFFLSKYLIRMGNKDEAIKSLKKALRQLPSLSLAAKSDKDLSDNKEVFELCNKSEMEFKNKLDKVMITAKTIENYISNKKVFDLITLYSDTKDLDTGLELLSLPLFSYDMQQEMDDFREISNSRESIKKDDLKGIDEQLKKAAKVCVRYSNISSNTLSIVLDVDIDYASRLLFYLEKFGIVGSKDQSDIRKVLIESEETLEFKINELGISEKYLLKEFCVNDLFEKLEVIEEKLKIFANERKNL